MESHPELKKRFEKKSSPNVRKPLSEIKVNKVPKYCKPPENITEYSEIAKCLNRACQDCGTMPFEDYCWLCKDLCRNYVSTVHPPQYSPFGSKIPARIIPSYHPNCQCKPCVATRSPLTSSKKIVSTSEQRKILSTSENYSLSERADASGPYPLSETLDIDGSSPSSGNPDVRVPYSDEASDHPRTTPQYSDFYSASTRPCPYAISKDPTFVSPHSAFKGPTTEDEYTATRDACESTKNIYSTSQCLSYYGNKLNYDQNENQISKPPCTCSSPYYNARYLTHIYNLPKEETVEIKKQNISNRLSHPIKPREGMVPMYTGHIPGLQNVSGETYGRSTKRLLERKDIY